MLVGVKFHDGVLGGSQHKQETPGKQRSPGGVTVKKKFVSVLFYG